MTSGRPPSVDDLADLVRVQASEQSPPVRLRAAIELGRELAEATDELIERFVAEARAAGLSWTEIGQLFGTSKQAAQKRYGATTAEDAGGWPGRWAPAARHALEQANEQARNLGHNYIGTEHVLLGLVAAADGLAAHVLSDLGVTRERILTQECVAASGQPRPYECLGVQPRLKQALEHSRRIADRLGHRVANTEHLLAGLVAVPDALAVEILKRLGVSVDDVREALARRLDVEVQLLSVGRRRRRHALAKLG
ncbi:MAG: ATP-dependent Clp protease ATP-binding subunit ClpC [Solirubrobacteraceae bacterium]